MDPVVERRLFLSVVFPAYNEEASIEPVVLDHYRALQKLQDKLGAWEMVCVDDASSDRTAELLEGLRTQVPQLRVVRHAQNQGIFASFRDCYRAARGTHIYAIGSDGQWPVENLERMLECLLAGADLVVGVRTNRREIYSLARQLVSFVYNLLPSALFGVALHDAGSIKLGVREVFDFELISASVFCEAERIIRAQRGGYRITFVPIRFLHRTAGKTNGASWKTSLSHWRT